MKLNITNPADSGVVLVVLDSNDATVNLQPGESGDVELTLDTGIEVQIAATDGVADAPTGAADPNAPPSGSAEEIAARQDVEGNPAPVPSSSPGPAPNDVEAVAAASDSPSGGDASDSISTTAGAADGASAGETGQGGGSGVSGPTPPEGEPTAEEKPAPTPEQVKAALQAVATEQEKEAEETELEEVNAELAKQGLAPITEAEHEAAKADLTA